MKNIAKIALLTAGILTFTACSDFLDQTAPSEQSATNVFESPFFTELAVNKLYGLMTQDATYSRDIPIIFGTNTDCELIDGLGVDAYNRSHERGAMNYNISPGWSKLAGTWDAMYSIIENANLIVEGISNSSLLTTGDTDQRSMERFKGEALTIRAMVYFDLIRLFGDIPYKSESSHPELDNVYIGKSDRDIIMDELIEDLEEAINLLPWAGEVNTYTTERVTKGYAHSLLANIALTRAGWGIREQAKQGYITSDTYSDPVYPTQRCDDATRTNMYKLALKHLAAVIDNGTHGLNPSFSNEWYRVNQRQLDETYRENIFEIPMGLGVSGELGYTVGVRMNGASTLYGEQGNSSGKLKMTAPYFWSFRESDQRRDITCCNLQLKTEDNALKEKLLGNTPFAIYCGKWDIRQMNEEWRQTAIATGKAKWMSGINCIRMRYPQVLLMYAETLNELADGPDGNYEGASTSVPTARKALELVHTRAFADAYKADAKSYVDAIQEKDAFFNAIVDENAWELAGEGFRKYDLIRWNLLIKKIKQFKTDYENQLFSSTKPYPEKVYFNYSDKAGTVIDISSVTWHGIPSGKTTSDYQANNNFWGKERTDTKGQTQLTYNLPSISSGLVEEEAVVVNRYLLPIASTTISASNGMLHNSYGFSD